MSMFPLSFDTMDVNVSSNKGLASMNLLIDVILYYNYIITWLYFFYNYRQEVV